MNDISEIENADYRKHLLGGFEYYRMREWYDLFIRTTNGRVFPTYEALERFVLHNKDELVERGALIHSLGRKGNLLRRDFGKFALLIFARQRRELTLGDRLTRGFTDPVLKAEGRANAA